MEKKLKQVSEGQGFVCKDRKEKERLWQKLTDAGYPMYCSFNESSGQHILFDRDLEFLGSYEPPRHPLNESDFFDEWIPKAGEWVDVSDDEITWFKHDYKFIFEHKGVYYCETSDIPNLLAWKYIRQSTETKTLQEVRDALGKPNLIITQ